jgi:hypothetical protein
MSTFNVYDDAIHDVSTVHAYHARGNGYSVRVSNSPALLGVSGCKRVNGSPPALEAGLLVSLQVRVLSPRPIRV